MSDLTKLKEVLDNQAERGIRSGHWLELSYKEDVCEDYILLTVAALHVNFVFTMQGRLIGASNWKQ